jgi:putative membrane protein
MLNLKRFATGIALASLCLLPIGASAQSSASNSSSSSQLSSADKTFVTKAAQGGMAEVQLGQLATEKAQSDDVKKFGQRMVDDHSKANDQLKSIASQKGVTLPTDLSAKDKAEKDRLSKLSGEQFDKAYMKAMVKDHKTDVAEFQKEANSGKDSDVKNFASQTLPTLQDHLKMAQQDAKTVSSNSMKGASTTASNQPQ